MATILRAILDAQEEVNLAFLLAPQAFRRQSKRGGEDGQSYVAGRFNAAIEDDWGTVLHHLMVNRVREEERKRSRKGRGKENSETEKKEIQRKVALSHLYKPADLLRCGQHGGPRCHGRPQGQVWSCQPPS